MNADHPLRRLVIGPQDCIPAGERKLVSVAGRTIGVFHQDGEHFALLNVCPHRGAPICTGRLRPRIEEGSDREFSYSQRAEMLKCPWHQWEFDIRTGRGLDCDLSISTYRVEIEQGELVLYF